MNTYTFTGLEWERMRGCLLPCINEDATRGSLLHVAFRPEHKQVTAITSDGTTLAFQVITPIVPETDAGMPEVVVTRDILKLRAKQQDEVVFCFGPETMRVRVNRGAIQEYPYVPDIQYPVVENVIPSFPLEWRFDIMALLAAVEVFQGALKHSKSPTMIFETHYDNRVRMQTSHRETGITLNGHTGGVFPLEPALRVGIDANILLALVKAMRAHIPNGKYAHHSYPLVMAFAATEATTEYISVIKLSIGGCSQGSFVLVMPMRLIEGGA